jgi:hypothetical protein
LTPHQFQQITGLAMIEAVLDPSVVIQ